MLEIFLKPTIKMWHIISASSVLIGTVISQFKKITQVILGLNDSQVIHPGFAEDEVYNKYNKYKKLASFYDKSYLFWLGLILIILPLIIEIIFLLLSVFK